MHSLKLLRVTEKIMNYLNEQAEVEHTQTIEEVLPLLESVAALFPNWVSIICPVHHSGIRFVSSNCNNVFGYDAAYMKEHISLQKFFSMIHPGDGEDLHACYTFLDEILQHQLPEEQTKIRVVFQYRFLQKSGRYIILQDEKGILRLPENKNIYYTIFRDISEDSSFSGVQVTIYKQEEGLTKIAEYKPSAAKSKLSKREKDIVSLIRHGLTNKEIAYRLNISHNTSRNIRSKLFEKFSVNNVVELLNVAV
ncbi:MAG: PAS domain-containing protein [Ferruginibacter sp.]|nr:PAS domain-containing protein [Ferruginibacter sp.]